MKVRTNVCEWCEAEYAVKDSTASHRDRYCSAECEGEKVSADKECRAWDNEIHNAWHKYKAEYVPSEDEEDPSINGEDNCACTSHPDSKREYLAFRDRYLKWKNSHCWKKSFWEWDGSSPTSFSGGGSGSGFGGGIVKAILNVVVVVFVSWLVWKVIKCGCDLFFGGGRDVDPKVEMVKTWKKHLEKRREAFSDGLSEKEVDAKGLINYTWEEWQNRQGDKQTPSVDKGNAEGNGNKAKEIAQNVSTSNVEDVADKTDEKSTEDELKRLNARITELEGARKTGEQHSVAMPKGEEPKPVISAQESTKATTLVATCADNKPSVGQNNSRKRASKDSKRISIVVEGRGNTKEAAVRYAIRQAMWKTVCTWVGSKARIDENRDQVVALLKTVTEADVAKFEVEDTQQQDGAFVIKVRVLVSKKQIAPKFAKVFPDVFKND